MIDLFCFKSSCKISKFTSVLYSYASLLSFIITLRLNLSLGNNFFSNKKLALIFFKIC